MPINRRMPNMEDFRPEFLELSEDVIRQIAEKAVNLMMELEVEGITNAAKYERTEERETSRNGFRRRTFKTGVGELTLAVPKLRSGTYFPSFLEPRRMVDKALVNVIQEAYINGVSTRKVERLVEDMGMKIDKSQVSRVCAELSELVDKFRNRPLEGEYPYIYMDATFPKIREAGSVQSMAFMVAIGVDSNGERHILGFNVSMSESLSSWEEFTQSLVERGLKGVKLVISDAHEGIKSAVAKVLTGSRWQRCRVHFMRNILAEVPKKQKGMVSATVGTIFAQENKESAKKQLREVVNHLYGTFPKAMQILENAEDEVLTYMDFPAEHHAHIYSSNVLERLNKEIRRRSNVVSIFPNRDAALRLIGCVLIEQDDEYRAAGKRYMSLESMAKLKETIPHLGLLKA